MNDVSAQEISKSWKRNCGTQERMESRERRPALSIDENSARGEAMSDGGNMPQKLTASSHPTSARQCL